MPRPIITLTTDFGSADVFVGIMKGVILSISPDAEVVDLTHEVPAQDIRSGAYLLDSAYRHFPRGTTHVAVVDPRVGTSRRAIVVATPGSTFVCPDNGLLSLVLAHESQHPPDGEPFVPNEVPAPSTWSCFHLTEPRYWRVPVSNTFHGRDVFAPVAAHLTMGEPPSRMGELVHSLVAFPVPMPVDGPLGIDGCVLHVDRYGNLITNIGADLIAGPETCVIVSVGGQSVHGLSRSYEGGSLVALIGSDGTLEIAMPDGDAAAALGVKVGDAVSVRPA